MQYKNKHVMYHLLLSGNISHGNWIQNETDGVIQCELNCDPWYEPDASNVMIKMEDGTWNWMTRNCIESETLYLYAT